MIYPLDHFTWQLLRAVVREKKAQGRRFKGVTGRSLRLYPSRRTKDGTFLDQLVGDGLLKVVGRVPEDVAEVDMAGKPEQFKTLYDITETGDYAAEYGEYEREWKGKKT